MSGPALQHLTVVELGDPLTEWCGRLFSQAGARVILVEAPGGAVTREYGPFYSDGQGTRSLHFEHYNTDKESVVLDLTTPEGQASLTSLLRTADILIDGAGPADASRAIVSSCVENAGNTGLVEVAVSPFGQSGPWATLRGSDLVHQALGGQMMMNGYDDQPASPPLHGCGEQAYHMAGTWAFIMALARLQAPAADEPAFIDVSVHDSCAGMTEIALPTYDYTGALVTRRTGRHANPNPTPAWQHRTVDGRYINAQLVNVNPNAWEKFVAWMDEEGLAQDLTNPEYYIPEVFQANADHISSAIGAFIATRTADEVFHRGQACGMIFSDINYPHELVTDDHLAERGFWADVDQGDGTTLRYAGSAFLLTNGEVRPRRRAPHLDEHGDHLRTAAGAPA